MGEVQDFVSHYRTKFAIESQVLEPVKLDASDFDGSRGQMIAENAIETMLKAYRWQYIISGVQHPHFGRAKRRCRSGCAKR